MKRTGLGLAVTILLLFSGSCGTDSTLPDGVSLSRAEAIDAFRDSQDGHDIDEVEARLVTWGDYEAAQARIDREEGVPEGDGDNPDGVEDADLVWVVGATGEFFNADSFEYTQAVGVFDASDGAEVEWGGGKGSGLPPILRYLDDKA